MRGYVSNVCSSTRLAHEVESIAYAATRSFLTCAAARHLLFSQMRESRRATFHRQRDRWHIAAVALDRRGRPVCVPLEGSRSGAPDPTIRAVVSALAHATLPVLRSGLFRMTRVRVMACRGVASAAVAAAIGGCASRESNPQHSVRDSLFGPFAGYLWLGPVHQGRCGGLGPAHLWSISRWCWNVDRCRGTDKHW